MSPRWRDALIALLMVCLQWQAIAAIRTDLRGPAHVHASGAQALGHDGLDEHDHGHEHGHYHGHGHGHYHGHESPHDDLAGAGVHPAPAAFDVDDDDDDDDDDDGHEHDDDDHPVHHRGDLPAPQGPAPVGEPAHRHDAGQRHWHAAAHGDMIVVDRADDDSLDEAAAGVAGDLAALPIPARSVIGPDALGQPCPTAREPFWVSRDPPPLERPPSPARRVSREPSRVRPIV